MFLREDYVRIQKIVSERRAAEVVCGSAAENIDVFDRSIGAKSGSCHEIPVAGGHSRVLQPL